VISREYFHVCTSVCVCACVTVGGDVPSESGFSFRQDGLRTQTKGNLDMQTIAKVYMLGAEWMDVEKR
jgi:hypothetical protein